VKRRAPESGNAVGPESLCEVRSFSDHGRHGTERAVASVGARRLGGVEVQERRGPAVLKRNGRGFQEPKTRWSRDNPRTDGGEASHRFPRFPER